MNTVFNMLSGMAPVIKAFLRRNGFQLIMTLILCGIAFGAGWWTNELSKSPDEKLLQEAYRQVRNNSIFSKQTPLQLAYSAIRGMLATIGDPYAELIEPDAAQNFQNTFHGKTGVVGLYAKNNDGKVAVMIVFPGGAAETAGIQVGDVLTAIDGKPLGPAADSSEVGLLLRGDIGSTVRVTVERAGQSQEIALVRREQKFASGKMLPNGIGYLSLSAYNQAASQQLKQALEALLKENPRGLIWDLRNNEGGDMQAAQEMLSYFIKDGLLFSAELTYGRRVEFRARGNAIAPDLPLVVLIDHTTYSAAETSAVSIADNGRGKTVGSTTYGKGVIQATIPLPENALLQMTIAKWYSPKGVWSHGKGVPPQVEVVDDPATKADEVLEKAQEMLK